MAADQTNGMQAESRAAKQLLILQHIRAEGRISRVELAERTGQSRATVTNITAELLKQGLITEKSAKPSVAKGRRRMMLSLDPDAAFVAGVKVAGNLVTVAVTDFRAEVRSSLSVPVRTGERPLSHLADIIEDGVRLCAEEAKVGLEALSGIGLGIPGFVDQETGHCLWTPLYDSSETSLRRLVQERLKAPTYIENDANAMTLAEQWFGHGHGVDDFLMVTVEDGVGMGLVVHGKLYRGARGVGTEFGHIVVDPDGPPCRCGKRGCIEAYAGGTGILRAALRALERGEWRHPHSGPLAVEDVIALARDGDKALRAIFERGGTVLGAGMAALVQIFNPAKILVSGQYVTAGDLLFAPMRREISRRVNKEIFQDTELVVLGWKATDWARGAASVVLQKLYESPFNRIRGLGRAPAHPGLRNPGKAGEP